jgi:flagellar biosynthetic protein FliS
MTRLSIKQYRQASVSNIGDADPHTLISIVLQHILGNIAATKGSIERKDVEGKAKSLNKALALIGELQGSLDLEQGGEVAQNLAALYDYSIRTLTEANLQNSQEKLDEVAKIFINIKEGWDGIPSEVRNEFKAKKAGPAS